MVVTLAHARLQDICVGDVVEVHHGDGAAPRVERVVKERPTGKRNPVRIPDHCPDCHTALDAVGWVATNNPRYKRANKSVALLYYCPNPMGCPVQYVYRSMLLCSVNAMDIPDIDAEQVWALFESGCLKSVADIYALYKHRYTMSTLKEFDEEDIDNLLDSIEKCKKRPYHAVLYSLGIPNISNARAKQLAKDCPDIAQIIKAIAYGWMVLESTTINDKVVKCLEAIIPAFPKRLQNEPLIEAALWLFSASQQARNRKPKGKSSQIAIGAGKEANDPEVAEYNAPELMQYTQKQLSDAADAMMHLSTQFEKFEEVSEALIHYHIFSKLKVTRDEMAKIYAYLTVEANLEFIDSLRQEGVEMNVDHRFKKWPGANEARSMLSCLVPW